MNDLIRSIEAEQLKASVDDFSVGDTVRVHNKIREGNRERIQIFEGTVLKRQNGGARETFTVRKNSNGIGVEKTWPLHSPSVDRVEVVRKGKVRRAKLYYLRDRVGKGEKSKETHTKKIKILFFLWLPNYAPPIFYINLNNPITFPRIVTSFTKIGSIESFSGWSR